MIHAYLATLHSNRELNFAPSVVLHSLLKQKQRLNAVLATLHSNREPNFVPSVVLHKLNQAQHPVVHNPSIQPPHLL